MFFHPLVPGLIYAQPGSIKSRRVLHECDLVLWRSLQQLEVEWFRSKITGLESDWDVCRWDITKFIIAALILPRYEVTQMGFY